MDENIVGQKFGRLVVISLAAFNKHHQRRVLCKCECGKEKIVLVNKLKTNQTNSCGCLRLENAIKQLSGATEHNPKIKGKSDPQIATAKIVYRRYSDGDLSFDDFLSISQKNCFYCGIEPSNKTNYYITKSSRYSKERRSLGYFIYNGLDRVNNKLPHDLNNVVPCCIYCNKSKLDRTQEEFFSWISKINSLHPYR